MKKSSLYWNGYYCVRISNYYYVYDPDGYRVSGIYSDDEPTLTNAGLCTCTNTNRFFSARREGIDTGRLVSGIDNDKIIFRYDTRNA